MIHPQKGRFQRVQHARAPIWTFSSWHDSLIMLCMLPLLLGRFVEEELEVVELCSRPSCVGNRYQLLQWLREELRIRWHCCKRHVSQDFIKLGTLLQVSPRVTELPGPTVQHTCFSWPSDLHEPRDCLPDIVRSIHCIKHVFDLTVKKPAPIGFHGSSFLRSPFNVQSYVLNNPPHTPKLPPSTGALALMAVSAPIRRSPYGLLNVSWVLGTMTDGYTCF